MLPLRGVSMPFTYCLAYRQASFGNTAKRNVDEKHLVLTPALGHGTISSPSRLALDAVTMPPFFFTLVYCWWPRYYSVPGDDGTLLQALLTTGRADLSARDASIHADRSIFVALKAKLNRELPSNSGQSSKYTTNNDYCQENAPRCAETNDAIIPVVFPVDGEFHRRTGKIRRRRGGVKTSKADAKRQAKSGIDAQQQQEQQHEGLDAGQGPDRLTVGTVKVKWFCGALAKTAERLSGRRRGSAEAFMLSVFEDFDR